MDSTVTTALLGANYNLTSRSALVSGVLSPESQESFNVQNLLKATSNVGFEKSSSKGLESLVSDFAPGNSNLLKDAQAVNALASIITREQPTTAAFLNPFKAALALGEDASKSSPLVSLLS